MQPVPPPAGDAALLAMRQATWAALSRILQPGAIISARVIAPIADQTYVLAVRGTTLIAESPLLLAPDSVVQIEVKRAGDQPILRLISGQPRLSPGHIPPDPLARLPALGLPDNLTSRLTVSAFVAAAAPLDPVTLQQAQAQIAAAPIGDQSKLATQFAQVARSGLPVMPLTLALAQRSVQAPGIDPGVIRQHLLSSPGAPALTPAATANPMPTAPVMPTAPGTVPPTASPLPNSTAPPAALPANAASAASPPPIIINGKTLSLSQLWQQTLGTLQALPDPGQDGVAGARKALQLAGLHPASVPTPSATTSSPSNAATRGDGVTIPSTSAVSHPANEAPTLAASIIHLAASMPHAEGARAAMIEATAATVLPPADLADYDIVLPLPMQDRGAAVPARLAVATRHTSGGASATYIRVDAELSHMGPISVRLSGHGSQIAVHLIADASGARAMADQVESLTTALHDLGLNASVRVSTSQDEDADRNGSHDA